METEDIDALFERLDAKRAEVEAAISVVEAEQAAGRTGLAAYMRAKAASDGYARIAAEAQQRIADALAMLGAQ